jgi:SAM-dependent methyltransferase
MHDEARNFTIFIQKLFPDYFKEKKVLDVGSGDINGNNKFLFQDCEYHGNDLIMAKNVTIVSCTKDLKFQDEYFDVIISTECFEHDAEYEQSLKNIVRMLKNNGMFLFTCASFGRPEHGTLRTSPDQSYSAMGKIENFSDYYKNLILKDIADAINLSEFNYTSYYNAVTRDLYFIGFKNNSDIQIKEYNDKGIFKINVDTTFTYTT